jgi:hypothetical protein
MESTNWFRVKSTPPPQNTVVMTKIHDWRGERNLTELKLVNRLWWFPDGSMYVYYEPTHWYPLAP